MRVARFWARAQVEEQGYGRGAWGGSDASLEEAQAIAEEKARQKVAEVVAADDWSLHHYDYERHDMPEPIVQDMHDASGDRIAAITINRYGANVLNTARLVFVDVDFPEPSPGPGFVGRLLGRKRPVEDFQGAALSRLSAWAQEDAARGARVYKTAAGLRYLLTFPAMAPDGQDTSEMMRELGADPLYAKLCQAQGSFRARLSPKPWRIGVSGTPKLSYEKLENPSAEARAWMLKYEDACRGYAVCSLIDEIGQTRPPDDNTARIIAMHDERAGVGKGLPLA